MTFATGARHGLSFTLEETFGVTPETPSLTALRHTACSLGLEKTMLESNEIRADLIAFQHRFLKPEAAGGMAERGERRRLRRHAERFLKGKAEPMAGSGREGHNGNSLKIAAPGNIEADGGAAKIALLRRHGCAVKMHIDALEGEHTATVEMTAERVQPPLRRDHIGIMEREPVEAAMQFGRIRP